MEDNKQLILEGQLHVALQTIGKEACSLSQKEVRYIQNTISYNDTLLLFGSSRGCFINVHKYRFTL